MSDAFTEESMERVRSFDSVGMAPGVQAFASLSGLVRERGAGGRLWDLTGKSYIDWIAGIGVAGLGHSHPQWVGRMEMQLRELCIGSYPTRARVEMLERLQSLLVEHGVWREEPWRLQLYSGGAEAVESALRLARSATGRSEVVSVWGGFHGKTAGALSLLGGPFKASWGALVPGAHSIPYADCSQCPLERDPYTCALPCVELGERQWESERTGELAAVIVEPVQGTAGNIVPHPEFLKRIEAFARRRGALLIVDEMITGFGRTGRLWGYQHAGITPDILCVGKQMGGGFPVSGVLVRASLAQSEAWAKPSSSSSSFGGNPLAAAAVAGFLAVLADEGLIARVAQEAKPFLEKLRATLAPFPWVRQVRGLGFLFGFDVFEPASPTQLLRREHCERLFKICVSEGLLLLATAPRVRIQPALNHTHEEWSQGLARLERALRRFELESLEEAGAA